VTGFASLQALPQSNWEELNGRVASLYQQGRYAEAAAVAQEALRIAEAQAGPAHPEVALNLNNLGLIYRAQGRYAEAEPLYKRALAIWEKALGPEHPDVASVLNNLAGLHRAQGKYAQAEPLDKRALEIWTKTLGQTTRT
jgi:tetratricopeptide (TPR) repeat protein